MSSKVVIYNAEYEKESLKDKIRNALKYFDLPEFKAKRILIKPNLLMASSPDKAITTHPVLIEAIIEVLKEKEGRRNIYRRHSWKHIYKLRLSL